MKDLFEFNTESFAASRQDVHSNGDCDNLFEQCCNWVYDMLASIDKDQHLPCLKKAYDVEDGVSASYRQSKGNSQRICGSLGVFHVSEFDEAHPIFEIFDRLIGGGNRNGGLPHSTGCDDAHYSLGTHQLCYLDNSFGASNQAGGRRDRV